MPTTVLQAPQIFRSCGLETALNCTGGVIRQKNPQVKTGTRNRGKSCQITATYQSDGLRRISSQTCTEASSNF